MESGLLMRLQKAIVAAREGHLLQPLDNLPRSWKAVRTREPGQHPRRRTFQALRIFINQELEELSLALPQCMARLKPGGRLVVISFSFARDRIVKRFMRDASRPPQLPSRLPLRAAETPAPEMRLVGKAVRPSSAEVSANPRSRSAVMRVAERLGA